jgi:hypothetical protein
MATTPEGRVKVHVKTILKMLRAYWHMPVQNGMGQPCLDFHVCLPIVVTQDMVGMKIGVYVGIETKAPGKTPTPRQEQTAREIQAAGGKVFVIDGDTESLQEWYERPAEGY